MMRGKKVMIPRNQAKRSSCISLDKIIGITSKGNSSLAVNSQSSEMAFLASGVVCFYSALSNKQEFYLFNQNSKVFSCLAFSSNGRYLATGEGTCKQPEIAIWELTGPKQATLIRTLKGHKYGIEWLAFSPDSQYLVSIGNEHDKGMFVWSWVQEKRVTSNKITKRILSLAFAPSGDFFVTGGVKNIKMWHFEKGKPVTTSSSSSAETKCMASKNVDLAEMKDKNFLSVAVNAETIFALTQDGILCVFTLERVMDKWMDLHAGAGFVLMAAGKYLVCGCAEGIIRCFDSATLDHIATLPRPPPLGQANISPDRKKTVIASEPSSLFADTIGLMLLDNNSKLYALYSDRTVFIWDISRLDSITVFRAFLHHSASINQIQILPSSTQEVTLFATASNDKTIRFWHLCQADPKKLETNVIRNVYSRELSRIIYITKNLDHFKQRIPEGEGCIKCIAVSGDGKHVASGDSEGNLRVHRTDTLEEIISMTAHDSDVVTLDYNSHIPREGDCEKGRPLLASGSRDRLIHVFDVEADYKPVLTIDDHNSSIADLAFIRSENQDRLISCAADRSIVFRTVSAGSASRYFQTIEKTKKCYSITSHPIHRIVLIGEDKSIKLSLIENGKVSREIEDYQDKGSKIVNDSNYKIALDPSGLLCAVANLDRNVRLIEYYNGKVLSKMNVGEIVNSMAFTPNAKKLLMATNDGCIFIWRLSVDLTNAIRARLAQAPVARPVEIEDLPERPKAVQEELKQELLKIHDEPAIRCHDSVLPSWAKAEPSVKKSPFEVADNSAIPGKWGRGPVKIEFDEGLDDQPKPSEDFDFEEDKKEFAPLCLPDENKGRDSFKVTKSIIGPCLVEDKEEEVKEEPPVEEADDDQDDDLNKIPELEPDSTFVKNPMRQSISSSFWKKKQEDVPKVGFFQFEQVQAEPWVLPSKPRNFGKKQVSEAQEDIKGALNKLQEFGINAKPVKVFSDPEILVSEEVKNPASGIEDYHAEVFEAAEIPEEIQTEFTEEIAEDIKIIESPVNKSKTSKDLKRFDSPCNKETVSASKSFVGFSLSESQFSSSTKLTKQQYVQGFTDLRKSLQDVDHYFTSIDMNDPEYSVSFEESYKERQEILDLLVKISGRLGEPLGFNRENELLESFSKKLVSKVEKQLRKREKKRDRERKESN